MKKIALLLTAFIGLSALQSCTIEEYYEEQSQVIELTNQTIDTPEDTFTNSGTWDFDYPLSDGDNVLVYRWQGNSWVLLPATYGLTSDGDQLSYDYDFTKYDVKIYVRTNFPIEQLSNSEYNQFVYRQTFRVVVVPGGFAHKMNFSDYNATISALGLENAPIKTLQKKK